MGSVMNDGYELFENLGYSDLPLELWMNAARQRATLPGLFEPKLNDFKRHMRSLFIHSPWNHRGIRERIVYLERGGSVTGHDHKKEWTLIYFIYFGGEPESSLLVEGVDVRPRLDSAILVPPGVWHEVPKVKESIRYSVAFRVHDHDNWTLR